MLLEKIVNGLQGQVSIRVESGFPERVLNLCGARGLHFWNVRWESPTCFCCQLPRRDYAALRRAAKNLDCTLSVEKRTGMPFFLGRFRRRQVLLCGLALGLTALFFGSFFVWDFTIEGNQTVSDEEILRALERNGITLGTFGFSVDSEDLRNHVLLEIPELCWISVNVSGCRAEVEVRERKTAPERIDKRTPTNIVAKRDGLILKIRALGGKKCVLAGSTVEAGQLLISGVEDTDTYGARVVAGMGEVWARTWYQLTVRLPLTVQEKVHTEEKTRLAVDFGTRRINFFGNSSIEEGKYDKISTRNQLSFFGLPLPVTVVRETYRFYTVQETQRSALDTEKIGKELLSAYLQTQLDPDATVSSALCTSRQEGAVLAVTLTAECREQIGVPEPILTDTSEPDA